MAITRPTYCTREDVATEADTKFTARDTARIDRVIEASSASIDDLCHRVFYPQTTTRYFDWPDRNVSESWRLWLNQHDLISATTVTSGGTTIASTDYFLRPDHGPPYTHIEIDLSSDASYGGGETHQRDITITGVWAYRNTEATAGTLTAAVSDTTTTSVDVSNSHTIGVGSLIRVDSERLLVTEKTMTDTGVNIDAADTLTASKSDVSITLSTTTNAPQPGEIILIDSERMRVVDLAGTVATVDRAWDGTVLAAHSGSADIYAPRRLTVTRGAVGTTAATHSSGATATVWTPPALTRQLCIAESVVQLQQGSAAYAGTVGTGSDASRTGTRVTPGVGLPALRAQVYAAHGRKARLRAV